MLVSGRIAPVVLLALYALGALSASQEWLSIKIVAADTAGAAELGVSGASSAPPVFALALACCALTVVLFLLKRVGRLVALVTLVMGSIALCGFTVPVLLNPLSSVSGAVSELTGLLGENAIEAAISEVVLLPWIYLTVVFATIAGVFAGILLPFSNRWPLRASRYKRNDSSSRETSSRMADQLADDRISEWDALSKGEDPSA